MSSGRLSHGMLLAGSVAAIGVVMIVAGPAVVPDAHLAGLVLLAASVGVLLMVRRQSRDTAPRLVFDRNGVWYRDWGLDPVPWTEIASAQVVGSRVRARLCIELAEGHTVLDGLDGEARAKLTRNPLVRPPKLYVPDGTLDTPLPEIAAAIRGHLADT